MPNKTNFLLHTNRNNWWSLRVYCNEILVDEINLADEKVQNHIIKTKSMYHEDGNFAYSFEWILDEDRWEAFAKSTGSTVEDHITPIMLWHVLHNDHPMSFYVDSLNYTDVGWLKNRLWTNGKTFIFPGQKSSLQLNFQGDSVFLDNEFLLKNIKRYHEMEKLKLNLDMFSKEDSTQIGTLPFEPTQFVAVMKDQDIIIKRFEGEQEILSKFYYTAEMIKNHQNTPFMQFVDRCCMTVHTQNTLLEYYDKSSVRDG